MQWWCSSSQGIAWSWSWRAYPGVWLFIALLAITYWVYLRRSSPPTRSQATLFAAGLLALWVALDWPLGPLGSGYLASIHMVRYLLIGLIAPAFFLLSLPEMAYSRLGGHPRIVGFLKHTTEPLIALFIFNIVISVTHWPWIVDRLMVTQSGSFLLDIIWLAAGLILWWPIVSPVPEWPKFTHVWKLAYLGINGIIIRPVFFILLFSKFPAYETFELAPPIGTITALSDQQLAAGVMKLGTAWTMIVAMAFVFFAWVRESETRAEVDRSVSPS